LDAIAPNSAALLEEEALARIVLECVGSIPWHVGKTKIARLLKGSLAQDILKMDLDRIERYGALQDFTLAQITAIIDQLIAGGYLRSSRGRRPIILLTSTGRTALLTGELPGIEVPDALKMFIARERCRKCPHNPSLIASGEASPSASTW